MLKIRGEVPGLAILLSVLIFALTGFTIKDSTGVAVDPTATPVSNMPSVEDRLARPTLPAQPDQADLGSQVYYYVCMACHGDQGQGLSPEWVASWDIGPRACWQSKCHASNHPPEGFKLPETIPAVVSPAVVNAFANALELHDYIAKNMPWQAPGTLEPEEYWQLTAFLVRENGIDPGPLPLNADNAAQVRMRPATPDPTPTVIVDQPAGEGFWVAGGVVLAGAVLLILGKFVIRAFR